MLRKITTLLLLCFAGSWASAQVISSFPFFENFESQVQGGTGCNPVFNFGPGTWRNGRNASPVVATHNLDWTVDVGGTTSSNTGPSVDHTLGSSTGKYVYMESSCPAATYREADLVSPYLDLSSAQGLVIDFWYHIWGTDTTRMHLDVDTTQGTGAWVNNIIPAWDDNLDQWQNRVVNLSAFAGLDSVRIRFRGDAGLSNQPGGGFQSDFALDDILLYIPSPVDLGALALTGLSSGCGIDTQSVTFNGFQNGTDTIMAGDTIMLTYQLNGAGAVMEPYILSAPIVPGGTFSYTFSVPANFSTPGNYLVEAWSTYAPDTQFGNDTSSAVVLSVPILSGYPVILEDFEAGSGGWTQGGTGSFALGTPSAPIINSAASGTNAWATNLTGTYGTNEDNWVESPCFDLSQYCNPYVRLSVWWNSEFSWDGANVQYSTDGGTSWNLVGINGDPNNWYNDNTINGSPGGSGIGWTGRNSTTNGSGGWVTANHSLPGLANNTTGAIFRVFFGSDGSVQDEGFAFDDFMIYDNVNLGNNITSCGGSTILNTFSDQGEDVLWSTGDTTNTITVSMTGWYSVQVDKNLTCGRTDSIYVFVQDSTLNPLFGDTAVCGNTYDLMAEYVPNSMYIWSTGDTTSTWNNMMGNMITVPGTGTYSVAIMNACGTVTDSVALMLLGAPTVNLGPDFASCGPTMLDAGNPGNMYMWNTSDSTQMITVTTSGTYDVVVSDSIGCSDQGSVNVIINAIPSVSIGPDTFFCTGSSATLAVANAGPSNSYAWSTGDSTSSITASAAGMYSVVCTDSNGCSGMDTMSLSALSAPTASFTSAVVAPGLTYNFTSGSPSATSYAWNFGDGGTSTLQNPSHTYAMNGNYTVTLTVTNACGTDVSTSTLNPVGIAAGFGNGLNVFPNPNNGDFHITFDDINASNVSLEVVNLLGQVMHAETLSQVYNGLDHKVSLGEVAKGYYFVRIVAGDQVAVKRISVK